MRELIKDFVEICAETLPIQEPIYEFGSLQVPSQIGFADLRPFFPNKEYIGSDIREGPGVDRFLNLHKIELSDESAGTILVLETLEHVEYSHKAIEECYRILKMGGLLIISSTMSLPIHNFPNDFWRFTPQGFMSLLRAFSPMFVEAVGDTRCPHTIVGIGFKGRDPLDIPNGFMERSKVWKKRWSK